MKAAQELGLNITIHAGEVGNAKNVQHAIDNYGAKRIGHGYHIIHDEELMNTMRKQNIHVEVCPTSSVETGGWNVTPHHKDWNHHPATTMLQNNILLGLNSDDPAVFDTSLTWQYRIALAKMGFSRDNLIQTIRNSIDAAFCPTLEKERLHSLINDFQQGILVPSTIPHDERIGEYD